MRGLIIFALQACLAVSLAAKSGQRCFAFLNKPEPPDSLCEVRGILEKSGKAKVVRRYRLQASRLSQSLHSVKICVRNCAQDPSCSATSYDLAAGICETYASDFEISKDFKKDKDSTTFFYTRNCLHFSGLCLLKNPSFENVTYGRPEKGFEQGAQDVNILPWSYKQANTLPGDFVSLATPDNRPKNAQPAPDGVNFGLISISQSETLFFSQLVHIEAQTNYLINFYYSFLSYSGPEIPSNNGYTISACFNDTCYSFATLTKIDTTWKLAERGTMQFNTGGTKGKYVLGEVMIKVVGPTGFTSGEAKFGLDDVLLEKVGS